MSAGALTQLGTEVPLGPAAAFIETFETSNHPNSLFKNSFVSHLPFAKATIENTHDGQTGWGRRSRYLIIRAGDLIAQERLVLTLPSLNNYLGANGGTVGLAAGDEPWGTNGGNIRWIYGVGNAIATNVQMVVGSTTIDEYDHRIAEIRYLLHTQDDGFHGNSLQRHDESTGHWSTDIAEQALWSYHDRRLEIPLQFDHNRHLDKPLAKIALYNHDQYYYVTFNNYANLIAYEGGTGVYSPTYRQDAAPNDHDFYTILTTGAPDIAPVIHSDFIFLTKPEREYWANTEHVSQLFTQTQRIRDPFNKRSGENRVIISLQESNPVRALYWVVEPTQHGDGSQPAVNNSTPSINVYESWRYDRHNQTAYQVNPPGGVAATTISPRWADGFETATITLNTHDLIRDAPASYFRTITGSQFGRKAREQEHARGRAIYFFPYDLMPFQTKQPAGMLNASFLDTIDLTLTFNNTAGDHRVDQTTNPYNIYIYDEHWNTRTIKGGMLGVDFSN